MTHSRVNLTPLFVKSAEKLTKFRVKFDPELSMTPMDPFPDHADPGAFKVFQLGPQPTRIYQSQDP